MKEIQNNIDETNIDDIIYQGHNSITQSHVRIRAFAREFLGNELAGLRDTINNILGLNNRNG